MMDIQASNGFEQSTSETSQMDFKSHLDIDCEGEWLEVIKDIIAMANSGGGCIVFGIQDNGAPSSFDTECLFKYDTANITAKVRKWTAFDLPNMVWLRKQFGQKTVAYLKIAGLD